MKLPFHFNAHQKIFHNSKSLRQGQTKAEARLWKYVRNRKIAGKKIRRQHPVGSYIVDFYCHECLLVIEVDGFVHLVDDNPQYDAEREKQLENLGLRVIRFTNDQVLCNLELVLLEIRKHLENTIHLPHPSPFRRGAGGEG